MRLHSHCLSNLDNSGNNGKRKVNLLLWRFYSVYLTVLTTKIYDVTYILIKSVSGQPDLPYSLGLRFETNALGVLRSYIKPGWKYKRGVCMCVDWGTVIRHRSSGLSPAQAGRKTPDSKCNFSRTPLCKENYHLNSYVSLYTALSTIVLGKLFTRDAVDLD